MVISAIGDRCQRQKLLRKVTGCVKTPDPLRVFYSHQSNDDIFVAIEQFKTSF
ncbi:MAG: hypothetical protein J7647_02060 [Cyanobacteria bacterium SBLK]|nr:hypothetical protein [Cyanobacteria bacterium SBLK]